MIAMNLLTKKEYHVKECEPQYIPILNTAELMIEDSPYIILLKRVKTQLHNIEEGFLYIHYQVNENIYTSLLTHRIQKSNFNLKQTTQLTLF